MKMKISAISIVLVLFIPLVSVAAKTTLNPIVTDDFNYALGSIVGQGGWTSYSNGQNFVVEDSVAIRHGKALHNYAIGDSVITKTGTSRTNGKQVIYVRTENRSSWGLYPDGNAQVRLSKGQSFASSIFAAVSFKSDGHVAYYDPIADAYTTFASYQDNCWTKLAIEWRSSDKTARYSVNGGAWTPWLTFKNAASFTDFDNVGFDFDLPSGSGGVYFDALK